MAWAFADVAVLVAIDGIVAVLAWKLLRGGALWLTVLLSLRQRRPAAVRRRRRPTETGRITRARNKSA